jgi:hypothetical protein
MHISVEHVRDLRKNLLADLSSRYIAFENRICSIASSQEQILKAAYFITKKAEGINVAAKEIEDRVGKVGDTTDQIASTTKPTRMRSSPNQASPSEPWSTSNSWMSREISRCSNRDASCSAAAVSSPTCHRNRPPHLTR